MSDKTDKVANDEKDVVTFDGTHKGKPLNVSLRCIPATALVGMKRAIYIQNAQTWYRAKMTPNGSDGEAHNIPTGVEATALLLLSRTSYPDLLSCAVDVEGLDLEALTLDEFIALPDALIGAWEDVAYRINPHWLPTGDEGESQEERQKKETPPNSTSADE